MEETSKVIVLPFIRSRNIENAVNKLNVAVKDVEEPKGNINDGYLNISNELNNLISNIHGESQLIELLTKSVNSDNKQLTKLINSIKHNCLKLTKSFNNIMELQKIRDNQFCLSFSNVDIVEIVDDIAINVSKTIKDKKVIFDTTIEEKYISCDIGTIQKSILILLSNAVKFSCEEEVFVDLNIFENNVNITISFKTKNSRLLNVFIDKLDNLKLNSIEDLTLSLYLCKAIIELHKGKISVEENRDEICFSIQLPCENTNSIYYLFRSDKMFKNENLTEQIKIEFSDLYDI